jgi:hypothetical protein
MKRTKKSLWIDEDVAKMLSDCAAQTGLSQSQIVNDAVRSSNAQEARYLSIIESIVERSIEHLWATVQETLDKIIQNQNENLRAMLKDELKLILNESGKK